MINFSLKCHSFQYEMFKLSSNQCSSVGARSLLSMQWKEELILLCIWHIRKFRLSSLYGNIYIISFYKTLSIFLWIYSRPIKKIKKPYLAPFMTWTGMYLTHLLNHCWLKLPDIVLFVNNGYGFCMIINIYLLCIICNCSHYYTN